MKNLYPSLSALFQSSSRAFFISLLTLTLGLGAAAMQKVHASHLAAGYIAYEKLPGANRNYLVKLYLYSDCGGIDLGNSAQVRATNLCGGNALTLTLNQVGTEEIVTPVCPSESTNCEGGSEPGYREFYYETVINLDDLDASGTCDEFVFSYSNCCRNGAISTISGASNADMYFSTTLNTTYGDNTSVVFPNIAVAYICNSNGSLDDLINVGAQETDADSVEYQFITPLETPTGTVNYLGGYGPNNFVQNGSGITLNSLGEITLAPTQTEISIFAVQVTEYREVSPGNWQPIAETILDQQVIVYPGPCNPPPEVSGVNGQFGGSAVRIDTICAGDLFNYTFDAQGAPGDNITLTPGVLPPGATATLNNNGTPHRFHRLHLANRHWRRKPLPDGFCGDGRKR